MILNLSVGADVHFTWYANQFLCRRDSRDIWQRSLADARGAIIGGIAHGFFITLLPALLVTIFNSMGFIINATATDVDTVAAASLICLDLKPSFESILIESRENDVLDF